MRPVMAINYLHHQSASLERCCPCHVGSVLLFPDIVRCDAMADGVDYSLQVTCSMDDDSGNRAMNDLHDFTELFGISSEH